jgi:uncharacterized protein (DUF486 family)
MRTILLLAMSNIFMTIAWYGHLKHRSSALWKVVLIFPVFSVFYLGDKFTWNYAVGFAFIVVAAFFMFHKW